MNIIIKKKYIKWTDKNASKGKKKNIKLHDIREDRYTV